MPDNIGPIAVPEVAPSGTFPLAVEYPLVVQHQPQVVTHAFASANQKIEQRFYLGNGARRWTVRCQMNYTQRAALLAFWDLRKGAYQPFTWNAPNEANDGTTTAVTVRFADSTLSVEQASDALATTGLDLLEVVTDTPSHAIAATVERVPDPTMEAALLSQTQTMIPLVRIRVLDGGVADIYLSDRRVTVGANTYLPRILSWNGIAQSIGGSTDQASFVLGNADRVMTQLVNAVDLWKARLEFSVYHVNSGRKLDLWAGFVTEYSHDEGDQFQLAASDGLYELGIAYPKRKASRQCWKTYKDGLHCTASSGLPTCDKSWANCQTRTNTPQFGGILTGQDSVRLKDNSTGFGGFGRNTFTATSIQSENLYGRPLPEIYTDSDMPVDAPILAGRDEGEFYSALGVVGEGPLTAFGTGHMLDDQPHHGPGMLGLRESLGESPANYTLFNISQTSGGEAAYRAAGTAFLEIRRTDAKGVQLSKPDSHSMTAVVRQGRKGWAWSGPGSRSEVLLTNPIWVAINVYLRALGIEHASAGVQEQFFDVGAAVASAAVCNETVTALVGVGSVTQFKFQGVLADEKPVRDWLQEVLNNCLGFYTFRNGRLRLGIRLHSGSAEGGAYGPGNILVGSLSTARRTPAFNHLTISYADREKKFAANSVLISDTDHIAEYGETKNSLNLVGTSTADQALRVGASRLREELGGVNAAEWQAARSLSFQTTVLGLATQPGQICSLTHDDLPGGVCEFRLSGWRLNPDWSIDYEGSTTTDSMYDLLVGPKPGDVTVDPSPTEETAMPLIGCWHPGYEGLSLSDPLFDPRRRRFTLRQSYEQMADGVSLCRLTVEGYLPVNRFATQTRPSVANVTVSGTGGSLKASTDYYLQVAAADAAGKLSPPSLAIRVTTPAGADTASITIGKVVWPTGTWTGHRIYLSDNPHLVCQQVDGIGTPDSLTAGLHLHTSNIGVPIPGQRPRIRAKVKRLLHSGVVGTNVAAVGSGYFTLGPGIITDNGQYNGRICSIIADNDGEADIWNFTITDTVLASNRLVVTPNPDSLGITAQDILVIRTKATSFSSTHLGDDRWHNGQYPSGNTNDETGNLLRIIGGKGRGQVRRVIANSTTAHTVDRAFDPVPDATSVWIIEEGSWIHQAESTAIENELSNALVKLPVEVGNYELQSLLVLCTLVTDNAESSELESPWREIYVYGQDALIPGGLPTVDPVTGVVLTSPVPSGWTANPDNYTPDWAPYNAQAMVALTYTPPADASFWGVDVWRKLTGAGDDKAELVTTLPYVDAGGGLAKIQVFFERPEDDGTWLFHLASRSTNVQNRPDFSDSAATEPVAIVGRSTLTAALTGATLTAVYQQMEAGEFWGINFTATLPMTNQSWSWITLWIQRIGVDATPRKVASWPRTDGPNINFPARDWGVPFDDESNKTFRFTLTLCRLDGTEITQSNPWGLGTSNRDLTIQRQTGGSGLENAPGVVINLAATDIEVGQDVDGSATIRVKAQWTLPANKAKYGGLEIYLASAPIDLNTAIWMGHTTATTANWVSDWFPHPGPGTYYILLVPVDWRGRRNTYVNGVTPQKGVTLGTPAPGLKLSRTIGELIYQGLQSAFEGIKIMAQTSLGVFETVVRMGFAVEDASTIDVAIFAGQIQCRVASIAPYIGLEGRVLRIQHLTNPALFERFVIQSINQTTRYITLESTETGAVSFVNSYPIGSKLQIDYQGLWAKNFWAGGQGMQSAPFYISVAGDVIMESKGSRHPAIRINKEALSTLVSSAAQFRGVASGRDAIRMENNGNLDNYLAVGMNMVGDATVHPYVILSTATANSLVAYQAPDSGGRIYENSSETGAAGGFDLNANRTNSGGVSGSPGAGFRSYLRVASVYLKWKLFHGTRELVSSVGDIDGQYVKHRHFSNAYSGAMVKAALNQGEIATWWTGSELRLVAKVADGSGNTPFYSPAGLL